MSPPSRDRVPDAAPTPRKELESWRELISIPPFHAWLGLQVERVERGRAVVRLPFRPDFIGNPGIPAVHGGIIAALVDLTGGVACFTLTNAATPTIDMRIDYLRPALEKDLIADASVINSGSSVAFVDVEVVQDGRLVSQGRCAYSTKYAKPSRAPDDIPIG